MDEPLALTLAAAARALSVSPRTVRRLLDAGELQRIRIGRAVRVTAASLRAYVDGHHALSDNPIRAGQAVREESTCQESADKTRTASTVAVIPRAGGRPTATRAAAELDALLRRPIAKKPRHSSPNGSSRRIERASGANNRSGPSRN